MSSSRDAPSIFSAALLQLVRIPDWASAQKIASLAPSNANRNASSRVAQFFLGPLAFGDIGDEGIVKIGFAIPVPHHVSEKLDRHAGAVLAEIFLLIAYRLVRMIQFRQPGTFTVEPFRGGKLSSPVHGFQLLAAVAHEIEEGGIAGTQTPIGIRDGKGLTRTFEEPRKKGVFPLALPKVGFAPGQVFRHVIEGNPQGTQFATGNQGGNPYVHITGGQALRGFLERADPINKYFLADKPDNEQAKKGERRQDEQVVSEGGIGLCHDGVIRDAGADIEVGCLLPVKIYFAVRKETAVPSSPIALNVPSRAPAFMAAKSFPCPVNR